mmetsp:Transcript_45177/g.125350  ORF Transcript_45177/g.125350 Transcript_45177/m.125350 type:complete len:222 (+) Transcript_45177:944-1609(+)
MASLSFKATGSGAESSFQVRKGGLSGSAQCCARTLALASPCARSATQMYSGHAHMGGGKKPSKQNMAHAAPAAYPCQRSAWSHCTMQPFLNLAAAASKRFMLRATFLTPMFRRTLIKVGSAEDAPASSSSSSSSSCLCGAGVFSARACVTMVEAYEKSADPAFGSRVSSSRRLTKPKTCDFGIPKPPTFFSAGRKELSLAAVTGMNWAVYKRLKRGARKRE